MPNMSNLASLHSLSVPPDEPIGVKEELMRIPSKIKRIGRFERESSRFTPFVDSFEHQPYQSSRSRRHYCLFLSPHEEKGKTKKGVNGETAK